MVRETEITGDKTKQQNEKKKPKIVNDSNEGPKSTKKPDSKRKATQKGDKSHKEPTKGPMDSFLDAARNVKEVLDIPKGKDNSRKTRTPPSLTKDKDKVKRDKKQT